MTNDNAQPVQGLGPPASQGDTQDLQGPLLSDNNQWQWKLMPYMSAFVVLTVLAFLILTLFQLRDITSHMINPPKIEIAPYESGTPIDAYFTSTLLNLEADTLTRRYQQVNAMLLARTWVEYLGFFTGMLLACIGAVFILGKLQEEVSSASFEGSILKATLDSSSPGLVMAFLGVILVLTTIIINPEIKFTDGGVYLIRHAFTQSASSSPQASTALQANVCMTQEEADEFKRLVLQKHTNNSEEARLAELRKKVQTCNTEGGG